MGDLVVDSQLPTMSSGFAYIMSSKVEKKQKMSSRRSARKRAAQAAMTAKASEAVLPVSEPEPKPPEPLEEESGGYMLPGAWRENVFQESLRAGEQILLLLGKKGSAESQTCFWFPFFGVFLQASLIFVLLVLKSPPSAPRVHQPILYFSLFLFILSVPGCS